MATETTELHGKTTTIHVGTHGAPYGLFFIFWCNSVASVDSVAIKICVLRTTRDSHQSAGI